MNFFEHQAAARRTSTRLIVLFALAVFGIVVAVDFAVFVVLGAGRESSPGGLLVFTTLATLGVIGLGSLYRIASLRGGGDPVALQMGGVPVPEDSSDFNLRRLRNVVEEIAIASGVPVPRLYVLEHESAINAFAAGYTPSDAVVAVTRGALDRLNRDELQGVIAHEFSHILNGDMRLNIRLMGVLFGILMLGIIGRKVLYFGGRGRDSRGTAVVLVLALVAILVGFIGLFFGRMIKASVSRTRESLADASAVQFTRQSQGLVGALKKIGGLQEGSRLNPGGNTEEVSHMLFGDGMGFASGALSALFATHPPLIKRIQALDPSFRGEQLERLRAQWMLAPPNGLQEDAQMGLVGNAAGSLPSTGNRFDVTAPMVVAQVAQPAADDYRRADAIVAGIPAELRTLAAQRDAVMPLLLGLLLSDDARVSDVQTKEIGARLGEPLAQQAVGLHGQQLAGLHPMLRLPLAALAFPVLRLRPRPQLDTFMDTVNAVINADGEVSLFEYCLGRLLQVQVRESLDPGKYAHFGRRKLSAVRDQVAMLLAIVAQAGNPEDGAQAKRAYLDGIQRVLPRDNLPYLPSDLGVLALEDIWQPLDALDPMARQLLVEAITITISHDGRINVAEAELLRTICATLHCPLPPMLERA